MKECPKCHSTELEKTEISWLAGPCQPKGAHKCQCGALWVEFDVVMQDPLIIDISEKPLGQGMTDFVESRLEARGLN